MSYTNQIQKWTVPVDDKEHVIGGGPIVHVASQYGNSDELQVWTHEISDAPLADRHSRRRVKVVGTGQNFNFGWEPVQSVVIFEGRLVWHLLQLKA